MASVEHIKVAVIGAGLSGIGLGIKMREGGEKDFLIFDKAEGIGGTWRDNTYPGVECDIYAQLYSYSFAPNREWSKNYGTQSELLDYLEDCSEKFGLSPHYRFNHEFLSANWNATKNHWEIETSQGNFTAQVLVSATGYLSDPKMPEIKGLEDFKGPLFHSAHWDHDVDLKGKRVALVGTGATSIQIAPEIQPIVDQLDVYQRSPVWLMPKHEKANKGFTAWALRKVPGAHDVKRIWHFLTAEMVPFQYGTPGRSYFMKDICQKFLDKSVADPELRKKLQPDYAVGCKRILFSDTYYDALQKPNVSVITDGIDHIEADAIVTKDGTRHETDIVLMATGFAPNRMAFAEHVKGASGETLSDAWADGQYAYLGATVPGFPNFFMMLGPNTTIAHSSMTLMIEAQLRYITSALRTMKERNISSVDVKPETSATYNDMVQAKLDGTVWNAGGCSSFYIGANGKNATVWPTTTIKYRKLTRNFDVEKYDVIST